MAKIMPASGAEQGSAFNEATVLILCLVQFALICTCVYVIKTYCGIPLALRKWNIEIASSIFDDRILVKTLLCLCGPNRNRNNDANRSSSAIPAPASPAPYAQLPAMYSPQAFPPNFQPYPLQAYSPQFMPYPMPSYYPHHMAFHLAPPSLPTIPSASSLEARALDDSQLTVPVPPKQQNAE